MTLEEIQAKHDAVVAKNKELLAELKEAKKGKTIDPADLERVEAERDKARDELAELQKATKETAKSVETLQKQLLDEAGFTSRLLIENGLAAELTKAGVTIPAHQKAAVAMLRNAVQVVADGANRVAKAGDKDLAAFVGEWAKGEEGKHFVSAPMNSGGGASGGGGKPGVDMSKLSPVDRITAARAQQGK